MNTNKEMLVQPYQNLHCAVPGCGCSVLLLDGKIVRPCAHKDSPVIANISAHVVGVSK